MKKILSFFFAFAAAFLMGSCNNDRLVTDSAEDGILKPSNNVTVNIEVAGLDGPSTKAIKQGWVPGDKVKIWFYNTASQLPQLILTRNTANNGWDASDLSSDTVSNLQESGGTFCVLYEASNSLFVTDSNPSEFNSTEIQEPGRTKLNQAWLYHTPMVCIANGVGYSYDGETLSAVIDAWKFVTELQVVVTGINEEDAKDYAMAIFGDTGSKEGNVIGAMVHTNENKLITTSSSYSWVGGVPNADGAAFSFAYLNTTEFGTPEKISLYNTKTGVEKVLSVGSADLTTTDKCCKGIKVSIDKFSDPLPGALPGKFSVASRKQVQFSPGNLVATIDASGTPTAWKFAANQYDCLGEGGANKTIGSAAGDVDIFGWSTEATKYGISTSEDDSDYSGDFVDWGKNIGDGSTWRTLSQDEWEHLFETRTNASSLYKNGVTVCGKTNCVIIAPDNWDTSAISLKTSYDATAWATAETAGLVCLPAAGSRSGSDVSYVGVYGYSWSSTAYDGDSAYYVGFNSDYVYPGYYDGRNYGSSVRLITECQ